MKSSIDGIGYSDFFKTVLLTQHNNFLDVNMKLGQGFIKAVLILTNGCL